ncbi:hypothetical protein QWJ34_12950 [Saccharibacillus sp. CPCC 101409]|uniref:hypothetical protein n=1 Tax=Saccharibacillus sp. CPCC 101409 TaxID=3058041 RepID=UPI0026723C22|nr:hypothetical protein [Saccharibacillus sp. CPCC 101409]MDO3410673.1 hypothetical protein [Saccharibacillus sp. CPCC 101409]
MKALEVQLAVHRAPETSRMQHDQMQRPLIDQAQLAGQSALENERARHRSAPAAEAAEAEIRKQQDSRQESGGQGSGGKRSEETQHEHHEAAPHPFKGKHLDLSL